MKTDNLNKKESFILYNSFYELYFEELTTEEKGILIEAIFLYVKTGELCSEYIENDRYMRMAFKAIKDVLDRNNEKWNSTREARIKAGLSQEELSAKLELVPVYICRGSQSRIETGDRTVTDLEIDAISKILRVSLDYLFGRE